MESPSIDDHNIEDDNISRKVLGNQEKDDTKASSLCVFCCKEIILKGDGLAGADEKSSQPVLQRFFELVSKKIGFSESSYLSHPSASSPLDMDKLIKSCEDCLRIISIYCNLSHQLTIVELRLNWQIEKLWQVMRCANRLPSRLNMFRKWCGGVQSTSNHSYSTEEKKSGEEFVPTTSTPTSKDGHHGDLYKFRNNFKRKCKQYKRKMLPRVQLNRIDNGCLTSEKTKKRNLIKSRLNTSRTTELTNPGNASGTTTIAAQILEQAIEKSLVSTPSSQVTLSAPLKVVGGQQKVEDREEEPEADMVSVVSNFEDDPMDDMMDMAENISDLPEQPPPLLPVAGIVKKERVHPPCLESVSTVKNSNSDPFHNAVGDLVEMEVDEEEPFPHYVDLPTTPRVKTETGGSETVEVVLLPNNKTPQLQPPAILKKDTYSMQRSCQRSLRQVFNCSKCKTSFSSISRLEQHKATCRFQDSMSTLGCKKKQMEDPKTGKSESKLETRNGTNAENEEWNWDHSEDSETTTDDEEDEANIEQQLKRETRSPPKMKGKKCKVEIQTSLKSKSKKKRRKSEYWCTKCVTLKPFKYKPSLVTHQQYKHSNGKATLKADMIRKAISMTDVKLEGFPSTSRHHPCPTPECGQTFTHDRELEGHIKLHHREEPYHCQDCKVFTTCSALELIDHELKHTEDKQRELEKEEFRPGEKFVCGRCVDVVKSRKMDAINHYLEVHLSLNALVISCPICEEKFHGRETVSLSHYVNYHDLNRLEDPDNPFRCKDSQCSAYFLTEEQLHVHWNRVHPYMGSVENNITRMKMSAKERETHTRKMQSCEHKCPHCPMSFHYPSKLESHLWRRHDPVANEKGSSIFVNRRKMVISFPEDGLTIQDIVKDKKVKYRCEVSDCGKGFMEEADLTSHSKLHGEFQCAVCEVVMPFAIDLAIHETVHKVGGEGNKNDKAYSCSRCDFGVGKRGLYLEHFLEEHLGLVGDKKRCPICRMVYRYVVGSADKMQVEHVLRHYMEYHHHRLENTGLDERSGEPAADGKQLHYCERKDCRAFFLKKSQVREHVQEVHENISWKKQKEEAYKCVDCGELFTKQFYLRLHRRNKHKTVEQDFKFNCTFPGCGQRFEREAELEKHIPYSHRRADQITCPVENCNKKYWTKAGLLAHQRYVHDRAEKKCSVEVCDECGRRFPDKFRLEIHKQFHAGPETWKFECSVCGKKIFSKQKLGEHMRVHTKEKPFVCQVCGAAYGHRHNLRNHVNNKHGGLLDDIPRKTTQTNKGSSRKGKSYK